MAKQKKEEVVEITTSPPKANYSHIAYGLCKVNGQWNISMVKYDPQTLQVGDVTLKSTGDGFKDLALERFKIELATNLFDLEK